MNIRKIIEMHAALAQAYSDVGMSACANSQLDRAIDLWLVKCIDSRDLPELVQDRILSRIQESVERSVPSWVSGTGPEHWPTTALREDFGHFSASIKLDDVGDDIPTQLRAKKGDNQ